MAGTAAVTTAGGAVTAVGGAAAAVGGAAAASVTTAPAVFGTFFVGGVVSYAVGQMKKSAEHYLYVEDVKKNFSLLMDILNVKRCLSKMQLIRVKYPSLYDYLVYLENTAIIWQSRIGSSVVEVQKKLTEKNKDDVEMLEKRKQFQKNLAIASAKRR